MTYRDRAAEIGAAADAALDVAADRLRLEQEAHAATREELTAEKAETERLTGELANAEKKYADHMAAEHIPPVNPLRALVRVRVFPHYKDKNYGQHDKVIALLADLGAGASGLLTHDMSDAVIDFYRRAYEATGTKAWLTVGEPRKPLSAAQWDRIVAILTGSLNGMVDMCSGWNEPNHVRGGGTLPADWAKTTGAHQAELYRRVKPLGIKVGTPQLWSGNLNDHDRDLRTLAPLIKGNFDTAAWHLYPRGGTGADLVTRFDATYKTTLGEWPVVCTEAGYFTGTTDGTGAKPVTEAEQADLWPQHIRLYTDRGYGISVFEMLDDPAGGREGTLGIVRADWTPKPAYAAIKALLA